MKKMLFMCHGRNICCESMAEFVMKNLVKKADLVSQFHIRSAVIVGRKSVAGVILQCGGTAQTDEA